MIDAERVKRGLAHCALVSKHISPCNGCPYHHSFSPPCVARLTENALTLIEEQEKVLSKAWEWLEDDYNGDCVCDELSGSDWCEEHCDKREKIGPTKECFLRYWSLNLLSKEKPDGRTE